MAPLFTIGVTTFDRLELLKQTIRGVLSQTFEDFEVVVGNDNPGRELSPETFGVSDPRLRLTNNPSNLGEFENMNSLLRSARGRYFTWIADDDMCAPGFLQSVFEALQKYDYPACVFTSFQIIRASEIVSGGKTFSGETKLLNGREFLRRYLSREIETIGTMGVCETSYLRQWRGLQDTSADGTGFYSEYIQILRSSTQERVCYIDAPLVYFRVHDKSWSASLNTDIDQYKRATTNLVRASIDFFRRPETIDDFDQNLTNILKWFMAEVVIASRRSTRFGLIGLVRYFASARVYISSLKGTGLYRRAVRCLVAAEAWLFWALCKQTMLAVAPRQLISLANAIRSTLFANQGRKLLVAQTKGQAR